MRVVISVGGRFHAFNLAQQLHRHGHLARLIISHPKFAVVKYGIPPEKIASLPFKEIVARVHARLPAALWWRELDFYLNDLFDRQAARLLPPCDICVAWSGFGLHTIRRAKANGALTIIERGSSHIEYQRDILKEEYARFGITREPIPRGIVAKERQEYAEADYIAIPSQFVKRTFLEKGFPESKLIQVPLGVNLAEFHPLPKPDDVFRVINVGAQSVQKGTKYLLQAFAELGLPNAELLLVGAVEGEVKPVLASYAGKFRHIGPVPQSQLIYYYAQASVFVICSIQEGFGMVVSQAMACGLPVICTTNTGGADIVRDGIDGFVLPIRDVEALKEKILYLYEHRDLCAEMGRNALARVRTGFTWEEYGRRMVEAYEQKLYANTHARANALSFG